MRLLVIADEIPTKSDLLGAHADVLVSCGDLMDEEILLVAGRHRCAKILAVKGNHDSSAGFPNPIQDLHCTTQTYGNVIFGGFNGCIKYKPRGNYIYDQIGVEEKLREFPRVDV